MTRVYLLPGQYHVARQPCQLATLLGSCVGVCLRHTSKPYAAMNHYLLPHGSPDTPRPGHYGNLSTTAIIQLMRQLDPTEGTLRARIFGGAKVLDCLGDYTAIGDGNIAIARQVLAQHRIPVEEQEVGGTRGRRIYFDTAAGTVRVEMIQTNAELAADLNGRDR